MATQGVAICSARSITSPTRLVTTPTILPPAGAISNGIGIAIPQPQGPAGPPGPPGPTLGIAVPAGMDLGGHRVVCLDETGAAVLASADDTNCVHCIGITTGAAAGGSQVAVTRIGEIDDPSFAFSVGPVFLGFAGAMTQVVPTSGVRLQVGFAVSATRLFVHLRPPTILAAASE